MASIGKISQSVDRLLAISDASPVTKHGALRGVLLMMMNVCTSSHHDLITVQNIEQYPAVGHSRASP